MRTTFEEAVKAEVHRVREALKDEELEINSFSFSIEASGRVHDGETKIKFSLYANYGNTVVGGAVDAVVKELIRQHGWKKRNNPLTLTYDGEEKEGEEENVI